MRKIVAGFVLLISFMCLVSFHPYHVGSVEFNYNNQSKRFEIIGRFFMDDLENAVQKKYHTKVHFMDPKLELQMNDALKKYAADYLKLKVNNKFVNIDYLGYEEDKESVEIYLESSPVENPKKVETAVSFLYNLFDDQANIVHIIVNGQRKSDKLSYPNRYLYKQF